MTSHEPSAKTPLNIFISYAYEDRDIAIAVHNMLQETFGDALCEVFIDTSGVPLGGEIKDNIMAAIKRAHTMLVVATGVGRASHAWPGWELGAFEASHDSSGGIRGRVITLCLENTVPSPVQLMRYVPLQIDRSLLDLPEPDFQQQLVVRDNDEFLLLMRDILDATEQLSPGVRHNLVTGFKDKVKKLKAEIFSKMKHMIRDIQKPHHQLVVRYDSSKISSEFPDLPADATVTEYGGAFGLFGISPNHAARFEKKDDGRISSPLNVSKTTLTWKNFREIVSDHPLGSFWCASIARVVVSTATENDQVVASSNTNHPRRFRLILTTNTVFHNKEVEASLYLIETLQRPDYGNPATTMLLKGLHLVSRFRFMFLEDEGAFHHFNVEKARLTELTSTACQLIIELDRLNNEALQANLHRHGAWKRFVSQQSLETMSAIWEPIETGLRSVADRILKGNLTEHTQKKYKNELLHQLEKIETELAEHNGNLLKGMASHLMEIAAHHQSAPRFDASAGLVKKQRGAPAKRQKSKGQTEAGHPKPRFKVPRTKKQKSPRGPVKKPKAPMP